MPVAVRRSNQVTEADLGILVVSQKRKKKGRMYSKSELCRNKNKGGRKGKAEKDNVQIETKPAGEASKKKTEEKED